MPSRGEGPGPSSGERGDTGGDTAPVMAARRTEEGGGAFTPAPASRGGVAESPSVDITPPSGASRRRRSSSSSSGGLVWPRERLWRLGTHAGDGLKVRWQPSFSRACPMRKYVTHQLIQSFYTGPKMMRPKASKLLKSMGVRSSVVCVQPHHLRGVAQYSPRPCPYHRPLQPIASSRVGRAESVCRSTQGVSLRATPGSLRPPTLLHLPHPLIEPRERSGGPRAGGVRQRHPPSRRASKTTSMGWLMPSIGCDVVGGRRCRADPSWGQPYE
jgi:hypothetical protein